jgi:LysR family glycine cleavage system transcriptional activator
MDEEIYPVWAPDWLKKNKGLKTPRDLAGKTSIHDRSVDTPIGFVSWSAWLQRAGAAKVDARRGTQVNNSAAVLQAAIDGQGVVLARSIMARDDLAAGRLVRLFPDIEFASELAYYGMYRPECASLPKLAAFREWLMREAATTC